MLFLGEREPGAVSSSGSFDQYTPLPPAVRKVHNFPSLSAGPLMSIGKLCNSGYTAVFTATNVSIKLEGHVTLTGSHSTATRL
jgi:hypothetical protein